MSNIVISNNGNDTYKPEVLDEDGNVLSPEALVDPDITFTTLDGTIVTIKPATSVGFVLSNLQALPRE